MTFSVVARCAATGRIGVATASASLAVGARCLHARRQAGAVATQNRTDPGLGPLILDQMEKGLNAASALALVLRDARFPEWRQLAVLDRDGRFATHHGARCSGTHSEARGTDVVALGNLLASDEVPAAMVAAFEQDDTGTLQDRLLAALSAGLNAGGEIRPLRSAALLVVAGDPFPHTDLRVDHDRLPLDALGGLWQAWAPEAETCRRWALDPYGA